MDTDLKSGIADMRLHWIILDSKDFGEYRTRIESELLTNGVRYTFHPWEDYDGSWKKAGWRREEAQAILDIAKEVRKRLREV